MHRHGFTLLELIIVIIIIGVLATIGLSQYTAIVEKGRSAEAKAILGVARKAEITYYTEKGAYTSSFTELGITAPNYDSDSCASTHYFRYCFRPSAGYCSGLPYFAAIRCTSGGKTPNGNVAYVLRLCINNGIWDSDTGY